jgi:hypothetical protein
MRKLAQLICLIALIATADTGGSIRSYIDNDFKLVSEYSIDTSTPQELYESQQRFPLDPYPGGTIFWSYLEDLDDSGSRKTCAFGNHFEHIFTGGHWSGFKMFETHGQGELLWSWFEDTYDGMEGQFTVAAADNADIFYGVWTDLHDPSRFKVFRFSHDSTEPIWVYDGGAEGYYHLLVWEDDYRIDCTADGQLLVVGAKLDGYPVLLYFSADNPTPIGVWEDPSAEYDPNKVRLSADGSLTILTVAWTFYRIDTFTQTTLWKTGCSWWPWVIDPDGELLASNEQGYLKLRRWNPSNGDYDVLWEYAHTTNKPGSAWTISMSTDESVVAAGWGDQSISNMMQCYFTYHLVDGDGTPEWTYTTPLGSDSTFQDIPYCSDISDDGRIVAFGTWGNADQTHDEVLVFNTDKPEAPWFSIDQTGSCMGLDLSDNGTLLTTTGKLTHANMISSGFEVFSAGIDPDVGVGDGSLSAEGVEDGVLLDWTSTVDGRATVLRDGVELAAGLTSSAWLDRDAAPGRSHRYTVRLETPDGRLLTLGPVEARMADGPSGGLALDAPYPSPVSNSLTLSYVLPEAGPAATLTIYDLSGRSLTTQPLDPTPGRHSLIIDVAGYPSGVYIARIADDGASISRRFVISR